MLPRPAIRTFKLGSGADSSQPRHRGALALVHALLAVAARLLVQADVLHEPGEPLRLDGRRLVRAPERPAERDVALDDRRADEVDGILVPARGAPGDADAAGEGVDLLVVVEPELETLSVFRVRDQAPRRLPQQVSLLPRDAELRRALLELDALRARAHRRGDQLLRERHLAV